MSDPVQIFIVDDHAVVRQGIQAYVSELPAMEVVGSAPHGEDAVRLIRLLAAEGRTPDVVLMDLMMPGLDGVATTRKLKEHLPDLQVIIMTSFGEPERVRAALAAGATGYLLKDADADEVAKAISAALAGELYLDAAVARRLTASMLNEQSLAEPLSPREREVLALVGMGYSNREIADKLVISERTARSHVSAVLLKLRLQSRTQAALWAIKNGVAGLSV
ncbi:MAG TPA: response regulator transcription factor [Baekduia sp.]|uniref:response regulator transcription factor n=1 Tax=Baekduia sp. TaxID=2600305 RepID=UPI002D795799|nr:response regulator transcription factor [Baekduia sp.]HET6509079.1 response regulator transcription factor [Baekduia sp.]